MRIFDVDSIAQSERGRLREPLLPEETIREAYRATTTTILFTDRRILTIQLHMLLSERLETSSFSYRALRQFSMLRGASNEGRSEVKIWLGADTQPLHLRANEGTDLGALHRLLGEMLP
ncbi:MAG TPA: PH domain-containing protein [Allosphingosinicella sp.]|jgi:hypothetical protein